MVTSDINLLTFCRVMSWWDYGYQIAGMANRTTMVDNNTWNNSHIALVNIIIIACNLGFDFMSRT